MRWSVEELFIDLGTEAASSQDAEGDIEILVVCRPA
jgi:hypothetical protein